MCDTPDVENKESGTKRMIKSRDNVLQRQWNKCNVIILNIFHTSSLCPSYRLSYPFQLLISSILPAFLALFHSVCFLPILLDFPPSMLHSLLYNQVFLSSISPSLSPLFFLSPLAQCAAMTLITSQCWPSASQGQLGSIILIRNLRPLVTSAVYVCDSLNLHMCKCCKCLLAYWLPLV